MVSRQARGLQRVDGGRQRDAADDSCSGHGMQDDAEGGPHKMAADTKVACRGTTIATIACSQRGHAGPPRRKLHREPPTP